MPSSKPWQELSPAQVLTELGSDWSGLTEPEVVARTRQYGPNRLPDPPGRSHLRRFLGQFHHVLIYVLLAAAVMTALLAHWLDTSVILAVVVLNAVIGDLQEGRAEKAMAALRTLLALQASVVRAGHRRTLASTDLVPGDIVLLEAGDRVPADLRLLKSHELRVQEAILTGESVPVDKRTEPVAGDLALGDRSCMAFSGTSVVAGQATGVVVATAAETEIGRIGHLLAGVEQLTTPLVAQMQVFARWLTLFILTLAVLMLVYGHWWLDYGFADLFMAVVGLSVAAIPEGLPAVLTITLAVGVQAMARRHAIVRRLPAIETLGAVSVICSDKTGTLTRNEMNVVTVVTAARQLTVDGAGYGPDGTLMEDGRVVVADADPRLQELARVAGLCNDAELQHGNGNWRVEGDPMEGALLSFAARLGLSAGVLKQQWTRTDAIPFDTDYRYMATLHHNHQNQACVLVKGAPETLLDLCTEQRAKDLTGAPLDRAWWLAQVGAIAAQGQRVLALALRPVSAGQVVLARSDLGEGLVLLGLVGLLDPPRPEAVAAVAECRSAGIRVKMITGDHGATAQAIARAIGLDQPERVLTGVELDGLTESQLASVIPDTDVFARTSPEHKLRLVTALQARGQVIAMTGDGVNDAPALKRADIGIAMGQKGSEAAKEAAELVLADDNFASIVAAVREGRIIHDNIRKVIGWTLPTNAGEASVILLALLAGLALPVTPIQILWVNMVTAVTLGIALAFEAGETDVMQRPPRPRNQPLLTGRLVWYILLVATLFLVGVFGVYRLALAQGYSVALAQTMAMNTLVAMEVFQLLFIRNLALPRLTWRRLLGSQPVWLAVALVLVGQMALTYVPVLQRVFRTEAMPLSALVLILGVGVLLFLALEGEKQLRLRLGRRGQMGQNRV